VATDKFSVRFPGPKARCKSQAEEYCIVDVDGAERTIRFHDYHEIYSIPGLYEYLFCQKLRCISPDVVTGLLVDEIDKSSASVSELDVLEIGAGNGIVGELLKKQGIGSLVGIDIVPEAAEATRRDRPSVYDEYYIEDLENLSSDSRKNLQAKGFNCLVTVGALGFGDVPPKAFGNAYNFIAHDGWIAFNIKEDFLEKSDTTGFSQLVRGMVQRGILGVQVKHRYRHRFSVGGSPLFYMAIIAKKKASIPKGIL